MKVYKIVTDGAALTTGALMKKVVETFYRDMLPFAHLSLLQVFDIIKRLPYRPDPLTTETLMRPCHTMTGNGTGGDCLDENTRLLTPRGYVLISDILPGTLIMGKYGWTRVIKKERKGLLRADTYTLSNGGFFTATPDHRCILLDETETTAGMLKEEDKLYQCSHIPVNGVSSLSSDDCLFIGYYLSDGWVDGNRVCISGKDGFPKEEQKHWVERYATGKGWKTSWHPRYIRVYIPKKSSVLAFICKKTAIDKYIDIQEIIKLNPLQTASLLKGLLADSHQPKSQRGGKCFSTISNHLKDAVILLYRKLGISCTFTLVKKHGGLGKNPVWRVYPQIYRKNSVFVKRVQNIGVSVVYDIETADHGIYLPDADIVVHNCDDKAIALASYARLFNIPYRFIAIRRANRKNLHHVAVELYTNNEWLFCDPTYSFNTIGRKRDEAERLIIT
jgi:hypothetical protein